MKPLVRVFLLVFIGALTGIMPAGAQLDSLVYGMKSIQIEAEGRGELRAEVDVVPFFIDNEYKSPLTKGYTLPGAWLEPRLSYQPLANVRLEVGAHMLHFWGADRYPATYYSQLTGYGADGKQHAFHAVPIVRAQAQLTPNLNVVLGTIYGQAQHRLLRPLYDTDLNFCGDPEAGAQIRWASQWLWLDAWVNWQHFIFNRDDEQEAFIFGLSTRFCPSHRTSRMQWYIPVQLLFQHHGGEINSQAEEREVKTWLNAAAGIGVDIPLQAKFPASLNVEVAALGFRQQKGTALPFDTGYGFYAQCTAKLWRTKLGLSYWRAKDFLNLMGSPLYGTLSVSEEGTTLKNPQMLTAHAEYSQSLGRGFALGIEANVYTHLAADRTDGSVHEGSSTSFAAGIYLRLEPSFLIKKFKEKHP